MAANPHDVETSTLRALAIKGDKEANIKLLAHGDYQALKALASQKTKASLQFVEDILDEIALKINKKYSLFDDIRFFRIKIILLKLGIDEVDLPLLELISANGAFRRHIVIDESEWKFFTGTVKMEDSSNKDKKEANVCIYPPAFWYQSSSKLQPSAYAKKLYQAPSHKHILEDEKQAVIDYLGKHCDVERSPRVSAALSNQDKQEEAIPASKTESSSDDNAKTADVVLRPENELPDISLLQPVPPTSFGAEPQDVCAVPDSEINTTISNTADAADDSDNNTESPLVYVLQTYGPNPEDETELSTSDTEVNPFENTASDEGTESLIVSLLTQVVDASGMPLFQSPAISLSHSLFNHFSPSPGRCSPVHPSSPFDSRPGTPAF